MPKRRRRRRKSWLRRNGMLLLIIALVLIPVFGVVAKYIYQNQGKNIFSAKEFYFTSNLLTEDTPEYILNSNTTEVTFTLGNNIDELRFAQDPINYEVKVEIVNNGGVVASPTLKKEGSTIGGNPLTGTLGWQDNQSAKIVKDTIKLEGLQKGVTYKVTAIGKAGYKKTISATFEVSDNEENVYKHLDTSQKEYVLLTVWTDNVAGELNVEFPKGMVPDTTDSVLRNVKNYSNESKEYGVGTFTDAGSFVQTYSSRTYRFFVDTEAAISVDNFTVKVPMTKDTTGAEYYLASPATPK